MVEKAAITVDPRETGASKALRRAVIGSGPARPSSCERRRPLLDPLLEDGQRHRAVLQHFMELLQVELRPERRLRRGARAGPGDVAELVAARLADLGAVTLDLALRA